MAQSSERQIPTYEEVLGYLSKDRAWGRWGDDDQVGAVNLITPEKRVRAAGLVRTGRAVSHEQGSAQDPRRQQSHSGAALHEALGAR